MLRKIVNFVFSLNPISLFFVATIFFYSLSLYFKNDSSIFDYLTTLFALCIIVTIPTIIDSFLSNYTKKSAWIIVLIFTAITIWIITIFDIDGLLGDIFIFCLIIGLFSFVLYLLLPPIKGIFNLIKKIKLEFVQKFVAYIERLLSPAYLFPIKLVTYSAYYIIEFSIKLAIELTKIIIDIFKFPFKSFRNFLKSILVVVITIYLIGSTFVMVDYLQKNYGYYEKFFCSTGTSQRLKKSVVRIIGSYSQGTGFFITNNQVLTNFHVINGEPSPKIIFANGSFITPTKIVGDKKSDLAILYTDNIYPEMVLPLQDSLELKDEEPVIATGYAMGTELVGKATVMKGNYIDFRKSKLDKVGYIQTNISLVEGMSGGPLTDQCGSVVGVNTMGLAGLSLFISGSETKKLISEFSEQDIKKIKVDPKKSPEDAVTAFYTYLSARKMLEGFSLLSEEYLQKTNFEEWTNRFKDILDVDVYKSEMVEKSKDTVLVKFDTKNWVDNEVEYHYYEGTWQTILEDGVYSMLKSNIKEVKDPDYLWFYE